MRLATWEIAEKLHESLKGESIYAVTENDGRIEFTCNSGKNVVIECEYGGQWNFDSHDL